MEALILEAANSLREEGTCELSLGECPFMIGKVENPQSSDDFKLHPVGYMMGRAYHARGLMQFKAKFRPEWRPVYLCSSGGIILPILDLFVQNGSAALFFKTLLF